MRTNLIAAAVALAVALLPSAALAEKTRLTAVSGPVSGGWYLGVGLVINGMKTSGKKRDNLGSIGKSFRRGCNSIAESATKKEGNQPSFFVGG